MSVVKNAFEANVELIPTIFKRTSGQNAFDIIVDHFLLDKIAFLM